MKPSSFPVEAAVIEVNKNGQHQKKRLFHGRFGNGTREITDPQNARGISSRSGAL